MRPFVSLKCNILATPKFQEHNYFCGYFALPPQGLWGQPKKCEPTFEQHVSVVVPDIWE